MIRRCDRKGCNSWETNEGPTSFLEVKWPGGPVQYFCMGLHLLEWMEAWGDRGGRFYESYDIDTTSNETIVAALDATDLGWSVRSVLDLLDEYRRHEAFYALLEIDWSDIEEDALDLIRWEGEGGLVPTARKSNV